MKFKEAIEKAGMGNYLKKTDQKFDGADGFYQKVGYHRAVWTDRKGGHEVSEADMETLLASAEDTWAVYIGSTEDGKRFW